jgi:acetyltransferase-like isoleucine patch superfamily enzyme
MKPGKLILGKEFINTAAMTIVCNKEILFGNHVLTSWNTLVMDTDFHATYDTEKKHILPSERNVHIGSNVWIGTRSVILKGTDIADGCIVGACSLVSGQFNTPNTIIAGNPAQEKKHSRTLHREITSD